MSYSKSRSKYGDLGPAAGVSKFEKTHLTAPAAAGIDEDRAVELLVEDILAVLCHFNFKKPLGPDFVEARDHAINCLEVGEVTPRKVHHWVDDCLKCMDVLLIVYFRDILKDKLTGKGTRPKERDVYDRCQELADKDMKTLGFKLEAVYQKRSDPLVHHQIVDENGQRQIRKVSRKGKLRVYEFARGYIRDALEILIIRYRDAFPNACTDLSTD